MKTAWGKGRLAWGLLCGLLLLGVAVQAAVPESETPEEVVAAALDAFYQGDIERYSYFMHSEALKTFRESFLDPVFELLELHNPDEVEVALREFFGMSSLEEYRKLSNREVFAKMLSTLFVPILKEFYSDYHATALGHVMEGDHTAHVVVRMNLVMFGAEVSTVEVVSVRRDEGRWRMLLTADIEEFMTTLFGFASSPFESF